MTCICAKGTFPTPDGDEVEIVTRLDTSCPHHGFPSDQWYAGHPLRAHARRITVTETYLRGRSDEFTRDVERLERPSETYARLLAEADAVREGV